jgi:hypothetical protein
MTNRGLSRLDAEREALQHSCEVMFNRGVGAPTLSNLHAKRGQTQQHN